MRPQKQYGSILFIIVSDKDLTKNEHMTAFYIHCQKLAQHDELIFDIKDRVGLVCC